MTVQPHAVRPSTHLGQCVGFWLWALVGAGLVFGMVSFIGPLVLIPALLAAILLIRLSPWKDGAVTLVLPAAAGVPLLVVAGLQWDSWHNRVAGDNTPNPYYWGGLGLCLLLAATTAFAIRSRRS